MQEQFPLYRTCLVSFFLIVVLILALNLFGICVLLRCPPNGTPTSNAEVFAVGRGAFWGGGGKSCDGNLELVWSDEFDGNSLDLSKWEFEVNAQGGGNNELQYYTSNNVRVANGFLTIEARNEHYTGP